MIAHRLWCKAETRRDRFCTCVSGAAGTVSLHEGDASWHDGPGWYYTIDEYPDEGSCGAFPSRVLAEQHAAMQGYTVAPSRPPTPAKAAHGELGGEG